MGSDGIVISGCADCAMAGRSCCVGVQVFLTLGDVRRIGEFVGHEDFVTLEQMTPEYIYAAGDPTWCSLIRRPDGSRRVLRRTAHDDCCFLPLRRLPVAAGSAPRCLCRLHPYDFLQEGITGISADCPLAELHGWKTILEQMGMSLDTAETWHQMLYAEILEERRSREMETATSPG